MSLTSQPTKSTAAHFHAAPPSDRISDSSVRSSGMYSNILFTRASHHPAAFCALPCGSLLVPFIAFIRLLSIFCIISEIYYLSRDLLFLRQRRVTVHAYVPGNGILPMLRIQNRQNLQPELYRMEFSVQKIPAYEQFPSIASPERISRAFTSIVSQSVCFCRTSR